MATHGSLGRGRRRCITLCALIVILVSLFVIFGWVVDLAFIKSLFPNYPEMKPNTAFSFVVAGIGLLAAVKGGSATVWRYIAIACGVIVFLVGALVIGEYLFGSNIGIDTILFSNSNQPGEIQFPNRMAPHTAVSFALLGSSLAFLYGPAFFQKISEILTFCVIFTAFAALLGYVYGAEQLYSTSRYNSMALHSAALFAVCSFGIQTANTRNKTVRLLISDTLGGAMARRLLPAVILVPAILGWLRVLGQEHGLYDTGFGAALTILISVALMFTIIYLYSGTIHSIDVRRRKAETDLADNERRYRYLVDYSQGLICTHDTDGIVITVNRAALLALGIEKSDVVGKNLRDLVAPEHRLEFDVYLREVTFHGESDGLLSLVSKAGKPVIWRYNNVLVTETDKEPYVLGHAQDVTQLLEAQRALKNLSLTDDLTGLSNRRGFLTLAAQQMKLEEHEGTARGLSLMFADMDGLKKINDMYGHEAGSEAIIEISKILKSSLRDADLIARWGGDEFVILTIGSNEENINLVVDRIEENLNNYNASHSKPYKLSCSIGVAPATLDGRKPIEEVIAEADKAMYEEKRRRKAERLGR